MRAAAGSQSARMSQNQGMCSVHILERLYHLGTLLPHFGVHLQDVASAFLFRRLSPVCWGIDGLYAQRASSAWEFMCPPTQRVAWIHDCGVQMGRVENANFLVSGLDNCEMSLIHQSSSQDRVRPPSERLCLGSHSYLAFSPSLSCFPMFLQISPDSTFFTNYLPTSSCLRSCFWGPNVSLPTSRLIHRCACGKHAWACCGYSWSKSPNWLSVWIQIGLAL